MAEGLAVHVALHVAVHTAGHVALQNQEKRAALELRVSTSDFVGFCGEK